MPMPQEKIYTTEDIYALPDGQRAELIDGRIYDMAPPSFRHQKILMELSAAIHRHIKSHGGSCEVLPAPFAVFLNKDDLNYVEPDISVVCDKSKLDKYGCRGAPDMVVEILSPSTQRQDRFTKFSLYQRAGVREYWIVDPENKFVQSFWLEDGRYAVKEFGAAGDKMRVNVLEDCVIDLSEVFPEE